MNSNSLRLIAYSSGTTQSYNAGLEFARDVTFDKCYPGGLCVGMTFFVPRNITAQWSVKLGTRIASWNGLRMVWEGYVSNIIPTATADAQGMSVVCEGAWSKYLQTRKTIKPWADTRISEEVWRMPTSAWSASDVTLLDIVTIDRQNRVRFTPRSTRDAAGAENGWATNQYARVVYSAPTGQTIKRIVFNYDLQEGAQAWLLGIFRETGSATEWSVNTTGTGSQDITLATPSKNVWLFIQSQANQNPATDGTMYAEFSGVTVYSETGSINAQEITKDIRAAISELSTDETQIGALTLSLVPFYANGAESYSDIVSRAASYGDSSYNSWAAYVGMSDGVSDNLPRLVLEQVPALTDYDYSVRMDTPEVSGDVQFTQSLDGLYNWIGVVYQDEAGRQVYLTPDDDATLTDATSVSAYGRRETWLDVQTTSATVAANAGRRYLAQYKAPQWQAVGSLTITGDIAAKNQRVPACEVRPGKRIKIENWLNDISGTGFTLLITGTAYDDTAQAVAIDFGKPDTQDVYMLRLQRDMENRRV
jgi:hypothetical protein